MKPTLSIVMASYNAAHFLEFCLQTLVNQTYRDFELIIIDGLSTDNTCEIVSKYKHQININFVSERDDGVNDAFRKGFSAAKGDYICHLCASDGYFDPTWLERSVGLLKSDLSISAIFSSSAMEISESGRPKYFWRPWTRKIYSMVPKAYHVTTARILAQIFPDMGWIVRREVFLELFPSESNDEYYGKINPFLGFQKALYNSKYNFVVIDQVASYGRQHDGQWGATIHKESKTTIRNFSRNRWKYIFSAFLMPRDFAIIVFLIFFYPIIFVSYGGFGYYFDKVRERYLT